jgi:hypothetical protein
LKLVRPSGDRRDLAVEKRRRTATPRDRVAHLGKLVVQSLPARDRSFATPCSTRAPMR